MCVAAHSILAGCAWRACHRRTVVWVHSLDDERGGFRASIVVLSICFGIRSHACGHVAHDTRTTTLGEIAGVSVRARQLSSLSGVQVWRRLPDGRLWYSRFEAHSSSSTYRNTVRVAIARHWRHFSQRTQIVEYKYLLIDNKEITKRRPFLQPLGSKKVPGFETRICFLSVVL